MKEAIISIIIVSIFYLGRYVLREGHRIEQNKKFIKNLENFDKPKNKK